MSRERGGKGRTRCRPRGGSLDRLSRRVAEDANEPCGASSRPAIFGEERPSHSHLAQLGRSYPWFPRSANPGVSHVKRGSPISHAPRAGRAARHLGPSRNPCHTTAVQQAAVPYRPSSRSSRLRSLAHALARGRSASGAGRGAVENERRTLWQRVSRKLEESIRLPTAEFENDVMSSSTANVWYVKPSLLLRAGRCPHIPARSSLVRVRSSGSNVQLGKHTTRRTRSASACATTEIVCNAIEAGLHCIIIVHLSRAQRCVLSLAGPALPPMRHPRTHQCAALPPDAL